jgi:hypothetical protein
MLMTLKPRNTALGNIIRETLREEKAGVDRAHLELVAAHHGFEPHIFTKELKRLVEIGGVRPPYEIGGRSERRPTHIYSALPLNDGDLRRWHDVIVQREDLLPPQEQRSLLEWYARALFVRARSEGATWLKTIPQKRRLGNFAIAGDKKGDLVVAYELPGAHYNKIMLEAKNLRERIDISHDVFPKLIESALDAAALPVLCAAHVAPRAQMFCHNIGIALLHLGRRLASTTKRVEVRRLWPMARHEFHFVSDLRPLRDTDHPLTRRLIDTVKRRDWLLDADERWNANRDMMRWVISELQNKRWDSVARRMSQPAAVPELLAA